jgi:hypothetical protein
VNPAEATAEQIGFEVYRRELRDDARRAGEEGSRLSDPDGFDEARSIILELVDEGFTITADDVRPRLTVGTADVLGVAFGSLRREGLIEADGYALSRARSRHGSVIRRWRRAVR